jgi:hypothetical protein
MNNKNSGKMNKAAKSARERYGARVSTQGKIATSQDPTVVNFFELAETGIFDLVTALARDKHEEIQLDKVFPVIENYMISYLADSSSKKKEISQIENYLLEAGGNADRQEYGAMLANIMFMFISKEASTRELLKIQAGNKSRVRQLAIVNDTKKEIEGRAVSIATNAWSGDRDQKYNTIKAMCPVVIAQLKMELEEYGKLNIYGVNDPQKTKYFTYLKKACSGIVNLAT